MCGSSSNTNKTTTTSGPPANVSAAYDDLIGKASDVSNQPLLQYSGSTIAGFSPDQMYGMGSIHYNQGIWKPYYDQAANYYQSSAEPITPMTYSNDTTNSIFSPYLDATDSFVPDYSGSVTGNASDASLGYGNALVNNASGAVSSYTSPYVSGAVSAAGEMQTPYLSGAQTAGNDLTNSYIDSATSGVTRLMDPYTQNVVDKTGDYFDHQNQIAAERTASKATTSGAYGGDREKVAQALTAGEQELVQAPVIAGLYSKGYQSALDAYNKEYDKSLDVYGSGYNSALNTYGSGSKEGSGLYGTGAANQLGLYGTSSNKALDYYGTGYGNSQNEFNKLNDASLDAQKTTGWLQQGAGQNYSSLGKNLQGSMLTDANALLYTGDMQQKLEQAQLNYPYYQFQQQQAYPYQTTGWYGNEVLGVGANSGGTSSTTSPGASTLSQVGGLATTGLGLYGLGKDTGLFGGSGSSGSSAAQYGDQTFNYGVDQGLDSVFGSQSRGGRVGYASGGSAMPASPFDDVPTVSYGIPDASVSFIPLGSSGHGASTLAGSPFQPDVETTQESSGGNGGAGIFGTALKIAGLASKFLNHGGRVGYDGGGEIKPIVHSAATVIPILGSSLNIPQYNPYNPLSEADTKPIWNYAPTFDGYGYPSKMGHVSNDYVSSSPLYMPLDSSNRLNRFNYNSSNFPAATTTPSVTTTPAITDTGSSTAITTPSDSSLLSFLNADVPTDGGGDWRGGRIGYASGGLPDYNSNGLPDMAGSSDNSGAMIPDASQSFIPQANFGQYGGRNNIPQPPAAYHEPDPTQQSMQMARNINWLAGLLKKNDQEQQSNSISTEPRNSRSRYGSWRGGRPGYAEGGSPRYGIVNREHPVYSRLPPNTSLSNGAREDMYFGDPLIEKARMYGALGQLPEKVRDYIINAPSYDEYEQAPSFRPEVDDAFKTEWRARDLDFGNGRDQGMADALFPQYDRVQYNEPRGSYRRGGFPGYADGGDVDLEDQTLDEPVVESAPSPLGRESSTPVAVAAIPPLAETPPAAPANNAIVVKPNPLAAPVPNGPVQNETQAERNERNYARANQLINDPNRPKLDINRINENGKPGAPRGMDYIFGNKIPRWEVDDSGNIVKYGVDPKQTAADRVPGPNMSGGTLTPPIPSFSPSNTSAGNEGNLAPARNLNSPIAQQISSLASQYGVPEDFALKTAQIESGMGRNLGVRGNVYQLGRPEWAESGGGDMRDMSTQLRNGMAWLAKDMNVARQVVGRDPQGWESYVIHQQGSGGGSALLRAPEDTPAVDALAPSYGGNRGTAMKAITANGGSLSMTAGEFRNYIRDRYEGLGSRAYAGGSGSVPNGLNVGSTLSQPTAGPGAGGDGDIDTGGRGGGGRGIPSFEPTPREKTFYDSPWLPVLAAGLGMMASRNPSAMGAVGEGGLAALGVMKNQKEASNKDYLAEARQQALQVQAQGMSDRAENRNQLADFRERNADKVNDLKQQAINISASKAEQAITAARSVDEARQIANQAKQEANDIRRGQGDWVFGHEKPDDPASASGVYFYPKTPNPDLPNGGIKFYPGVGAPKASAKSGADEMTTYQREQLARGDIHDDMKAWEADHYGEPYDPSGDRTNAIRVSRGLAPNKSVVIPGWSSQAAVLKDGVTKIYRDKKDLQWYTEDRKPYKQ